MNSSDLIRMGMKNLWRRKLRTFLTVLGVIIGTSSIIVMLSLGFGMQEAYAGQIAQMGSLTTINVHKNYDDFGGATTGGRPGRTELDDKTIMDIKHLPGVIAATPIIEAYGTIVNGRYISETPIKGIDPEAMELLDFKINEGRLLQSGDDLAIVFGGTMDQSFNDPKAIAKGRWVEPTVNLMKDRMIFTFDTSYGMTGPASQGESGQKVNYKEYKIKTVGVLEEGNFDTDWGIYAPLETVKKMIKEKEKVEGSKSEPSKGRNKGYEHVMVKVEDMKNVQTVQDSIKDMGFQAYSLNDWLEETKKTASIMQAVLGGIGAVSLLVAAIGITNTMVMSIYERTKEIGVMKVIGASLKDIKRLFLFESAIIGLLGGIIGVVFSEILSLLINKFGGTLLDFLGTGEGTKISIIPLWLILAAMAFSTLIGILSGYYPAKRAMNLSALEAIKTE
jgi:putative ABC transport system permease protein